MSQSPSYDFSKLVPGFDFLQKLAGGAPASGAAPSVSNWVAPTLDPKELERRIQDLKTVQFWLEQNTQAVAATIQALEVQRMTLATLQGMNVSMGQLADALKVKPVTEDSGSSSPQASATKQSASKGPKNQAKPRVKTADAGGTPESGAVDPMAWWGSLTQQFQQIAGEAVKDMQDKAQKMAATPPEQPKTTPKTAPKAAKPARKTASNRQRSRP